MTKILKYLCIPFAFVALFAATSFASTAAAPDDGKLIDLLAPVIDAFRDGKTLYAGMLFVIFALAAAKRYAPGKVGAWLHTDVGGALTALVGSFAATMASRLATDPFSWAMSKTALTIAIGAAGGYAMIKKLIVEPLLKPLAAKAPKWAQPIFAIVFWIFDKKTPVEKAEAAGEAAVKADPAAGRGKVTEIE